MIDFASIVGIVMGVSVLCFGILTAPDGKLKYFVDPASLLIVVGGTAAAILITFPLSGRLQTTMTPC